jgi:hypothetical protein
MNRPNGLLLTAWIMVALTVAGWLRQQYFPPHPHIAHLHAFTTVVGLVIRITAFVCIFYYVRGRNWARIAVLLTSIVAILSLLQLRHEDVPGPGDRRSCGPPWRLLPVLAEQTYRSRVLQAGRIYHWAIMIPTARVSAGVTVRREKALDFSGCNSRPGTGSLHPVAIETAVETNEAVGALDGKGR